MADNASSSSPAGGEIGFWTFDAVEERLIEAMHLWERSPGGGRWPFAGDAPWHLMTRATRAQAGKMADMELWKVIQEDDARETIDRSGGDGPLPLTRADVARRDEASEWLTLVPEADRALVVLALGCLAGGASKVPWMRLKRRLGVQFGADGLRKRYSRAVTAIATALNRRETAKGACQEGK